MLAALAQVTFTPQDFLGPVAALVGSIAVIGFLARILLEYIADLKKSRDVAIEGWRAQTDATNRLGDVIEADRREREQRRRWADEAEPRRT